jgi:hypothetical protein
MPKFVSKPSVSEGIEPTEDSDLTTKGYVDSLLTIIDGGAPGSTYLHGED